MRIFSLFPVMIVSVGLLVSNVCLAEPLITTESICITVSLTEKDLADGKETGFEAAMPEPVQFLLKRNTPNGIMLAAVYGTTAENLLGTLPTEMMGFGNYGELEEGFSIQVTACDLNGDAIPELLVATGDGAAILTVAVFVYSPHTHECFRLIGVIEGQRSVHLGADGAITAAYGSQGLFREYTVTAGGVLKESTD